MTSQRNLRIEKKPEDHEKILLDHYDWLLDWARQLTRESSEEPEDLVQELYVRFVQMRSTPELPDEDHVRAYLYKALKNLFVSRKLREGRDAITGLQVVDFDSVEFAVTAVDRSKLLYVRSDLAGVCEYASVRRRTSRAAAALTLRFFLGYLPTEIMALFRMNRVSVDALIQTARLEAKAYLERPGVLRFISRDEKKAPKFPRYLPEDPDALLAELHRRVFADTSGDCLPQDVLSDRYREAAAPAFSTEEIAHLVSCIVCLPLACQILGLPNLTTQDFPDAQPPGGAAPPMSGTDSGDLNRLRRRLRETFEHRPTKLQMVVDGEVLGVQTVTGKTSSFQIKLKPLSNPGFVEVLSEQGLGLLYLDLQRENQNPSGSQQAEVELSDGRYLRVVVTLFAGSPVIDATYYDPLFGLAADDALAPNASHSEAPYALTHLPVDLPSSGDPKSRRGIARLLRWLGRAKMIGIGLALAGAVLILTFDVVGPIHSRSTPPESARHLMARSIQKSIQTIPDHGGARGSFSLEERSNDGKWSWSGNVDSLRSVSTRAKALQLRGRDGSLIAGLWVDAAGKVTDHTTIRKNHGAHRDGVELLDLAWQQVPDANNFELLAGDEQQLTLDTTQDSYQVNFTRTATSDSPQIVEAHLQIAQATLRAVSEVLRVQKGGEVREFRFKEVSYEVLRPDQLRSQDFQPAGGDMMRGASTSPDRSNSHLALQALELISSAGDDVDHAVDLDRRASGAISLSGVVPTPAERDDLIRRLRALRGSESLKLDLHATGEAQARPASPVARAEILTSASLTDEKLPFDAMLRPALIARGIVGADLEATIQQRAREIVDSGSNLHRNAWMVAQIGVRDFSARDLARMSLSDQEHWLNLLAHYLDACDTSLATVSKGLDLKSNSNPDDLPFTRVEDLALTATEFSYNAQQLDQTLAAGFALPMADPPEPSRAAEIPPLLAKLQRQERMLTATVERLQRLTAARHP